MSTSQNELPEMEIASQIGLKAPKDAQKNPMVIGIISLKTTNVWVFYDSGDRIWQPFLVSSHPIFNFLEPCASGLRLFDCIVRPHDCGNLKKKYFTYIFLKYVVVVY